MNLEVDEGIFSVLGWMTFRAVGEEVPVVVVSECEGSWDSGVEGSKSSRERLAILQSR